MTQPRILCVTLSDDTGSERVVVELGRRGAACAVMGRPGALAARSKWVSHHAHLPSRFGPWGAAMGVERGLERVLAEWRPDAVVPLDDMSASMLRDVATAPHAKKRVRALLQSSLGDPRHYRTVCSRERLLDAARVLGLRVAAYRPARSAAEAEAASRALGFPLLVKREATCGSKGVVLVHDAAHLEHAYTAAARRAGLKRALRSLAGFASDRAGAAVTLQAHVEGVLAMRSVACQRGRVLVGASLAAAQLDPPMIGSSTVVRPIEHGEMAETARRLVEALGCSGFVSFDFILSSNGAAHLIEMNPRPIGSGHVSTLYGVDLYGAWLSTFPGFVEVAPSGVTAPPRLVALFPKELARDPDSPFLHAPDVVHDVPRDEPALIEGCRARVLRRHRDAGLAVERSIGAAPERVRAREADYGSLLGSARLRS